MLIFESMIKKDIAFLVLAGMLGTLIAMHLLAGYKSEVRAIVKLRNIVQRLNASIQVESDNTFGLEWEKLKPQIKNRKSRNIMPATAQEIEYDLIEVLDLIVGRKKKDSDYFR